MLVMDSRENWYLLGGLVVGTLGFVGLSVGAYVAYRQLSKHEEKGLTQLPSTSSMLSEGQSVVGYVRGKPVQITVSSVGNGKFMRSDAASAMNRMKAAAEVDGYSLNIVSAFRTYEEQQTLRDLYLQGKGNLAAKAGYSNHQGGISADIQVGNYSNPTYLWLRNNARQFGFVNDVRGEPWHWTYHG